MFAEINSHDARAHCNQEPKRSSAIVLASGGKAGLRTPRASKELVEMEDAINGQPSAGCRQMH